MGHLKALKAVRTYALSTRWCNLWAFANRLDIRQPCLGAATAAAARGTLPAVRLRRREKKFDMFVKTLLLLQRLPLMPLESLRICWGYETVHGGTNVWVAHAVMRGVVEIELFGKHHHNYPWLEYMSFIAPDRDNVKIHLKILNLSMSGWMAPLSRSSALLEFGPCGPFIKF
jgi:hypothetical protein